GFYALLLLLAASMWIIAGLLFAGVEEYAGETGGGGNALAEAFQSLSLLKSDAPFRNFVITRALLLCSALASPYFVVMAQKESDIGWMLGVFLLASSLASSLSASFWGWAADTSSRRVMIRGAAMASGVCLLVGSIAIVFGPGFGGAWFYPVAFFILSIAHAGVRLGRKTYLVDMAGGNKRTDYTAVSNTVIGFLLLATGGLTALLSLISNAAVIVVLGLMGLAGTLSAIRLEAGTSGCDTSRLVIHKKVLDRCLAVIQCQGTFHNAKYHPNGGTHKNKPADNNKAGHHSNNCPQQAQPEGSDLPAEMRLHPGVTN